MKVPQGGAGDSEEHSLPVGEAVDLRGAIACCGFWWDIKAG